MDSNNLTKSGTITPAADFEHLRSVLVITNQKRQIDPDEEVEPAEEAVPEETVSPDDAEGGEG